MTNRTPTGDLREHLRAAIDDAGRHQVTIAADLGVTTKHLCAMLTGRARLTLEWAERIAEACGRQVVVAVVDPDSALRERLAEALGAADAWAQLQQPEDRQRFADAVLPVVESALAEQHERAERLLEHWADEHVILRAVDGTEVHATWCYRCRLERAEKAEAAVQRSREALTRLAFGPVPTSREALNAWRASLNQPEETPDA